MDPLVLLPVRDDSSSASRERLDEYVSVLSRASVPSQTGREEVSLPSEVGRGGESSAEASPVL